MFLGKGGSGDPNSNFLYTSFYRRRPYGPTVLMDRPPDEALARQLQAFGGMLIVAADVADLAPGLPGMQFHRLAFEPGAAGLWRAERAPQP